MKNDTNLKIAWELVRLQLEVKLLELLRQKTKFFFQKHAVTRYTFTPR